MYKDAEYGHILLHLVSILQLNKGKPIFSAS